MKAPVLNRRMVLEARTRTADGAGGHVQGWTPLGTLWAALDGRTGRGARGEAAALGLARFRITVRGAAHGAPRRPVAGQRLVEGARVFSIRAVTEADAAGRYLICHAEEERVT